MKHGIRVGFLVCFLSVFAGCASTPRAEPFYTRLFAGGYDEVWLATLKALNDYPLKISNKDTGRIQSETINGPYNELLFTPIEGIDLPERYRYTLKLSFAKLVTDDDRPLTRVRIIKALERFQDFYSGWAASNSDGLEEQLLLYRVEHILQMDQLMNETP
ncbi:hypothetical protein K2X33_00995 [bacterium]|nr:hypothetical protein [bacterium]